MYKCNPNHKPIRIKVQIWKRVKQTHLSEWDLCLNYFHHNSRCKTFHEKKWLWKWIKHKYNMAGQCGCFVSFGCCFVVVLFFSFYPIYFHKEFVFLGFVQDMFFSIMKAVPLLYYCSDVCFLTFRFTQKGCVFETLWFWGNMLQQALWLHSNIPFLHLPRWLIFTLRCTILMFFKNIYV